MPCCVFLVLFLSWLLYLLQTVVTRVQNISEPLISLPQDLFSQVRPSIPNQLVVSVLWSPSWCWRVFTGQTSDHWSNIWSLTKCAITGDNISSLAKQLITHHTSHHWPDISALVKQLVTAQTPHHWPNTPAVPNKVSKCPLLDNHFLHKVG